MFASMLMLNRHFQVQLFCWRFKDIMCVCVYTEVMAQDNTVTFEKKKHALFSAFTYV